jgi:hypothetical protein
MSIKIFQREIDDGLGEVVKSTASVAYCSEATIHKGSVDTVREVIENQDILDKILAENKDQIDLHYIESILVSTGWNKNDDVFLSEATWSARNTPEDKQFNFMHDENDIIGHITGSYVLDKNGKSVADDEAMPEEFDIITQAVLYNSWTESENKDRMGKIIAEIEEGEWFVSMECLFSGFDYALTNSDGEKKLLARSEDSAFLTKHLRAYGGSGEYEGYKVGRALSNISFSGKGLVSKPANPRSIILNSKSTAQFNVTEMNSNLSIVGDLNMSDSTLLEQQLAEVQSELVKAKAENEAIKAKIEDAKDKEFASTIEAFEDDSQNRAQEVVGLEETIKTQKANIAELEDSLVQRAEELTEAMNALGEQKQRERQQKRLASLVEAGFNDEEAEESLALYDALDDEAFDAIVAKFDWFDKKKKKKDEDKDKDKEKKDAKSEDAEEAEVTAEAFEELESSEATLVESEEVDELETTRASVADWFANHVLSTK